VKRAQTAPVKLVPLAQLKPHPRNPRRHDRGEIDALKASILEYGFTEPLIRQASSGYVVAGAGRLQAAGELAEEGKLNAVEFTPGVKLNGRLPVVDKALTDRQALAYCIADNRIPERASWDISELEILLPDLSDLATGYSLEDVNLLGNHLTVKETAEEIRPIAQVHVMLSFAPEQMAKLSPLIEKAKAAGAEVEQGHT